MEDSTEKYPTLYTQKGCDTLRKAYELSCDLKNEQQVSNCLKAMDLMSYYQVHCQQRTKPNI